MTRPLRRRRARSSRAGRTPSPPPNTYSEPSSAAPAVSWAGCGSVPRGTAAARPRRARRADRHARRVESAREHDPGRKPSSRSRRPLARRRQRAHGGLDDAQRQRARLARRRRRRQAPTARRSWPSSSSRRPGEASNGPGPSALRPPLPAASTRAAGTTTAGRAPKISGRCSGRGGITFNVYAVPGETAVKRVLTVCKAAVGVHEFLIRPAHTGRP